MRGVTALCRRHDRRANGRRWTSCDRRDITYEDALCNADSINGLKLNIKLSSKRARAENTGPQMS